MRYSKPSAQFRSVRLSRMSKPLICLTAWLSAFSPFAHGAEWSLTPSVQAKTSYNTNLYVSSTNPISLWGVTVSPMLAARRRTENSDIALSGRAIFTDYSKSLNKNADAQYVTLASHYSTLLNTWGLNGYYKRDTTSTTITEVQTVESASGTEPSVVNVNLVPVEIGQNDLSLRPSWQRQLTQRTNLTLAYTFNDMFYDSIPPGTFLSNYRQHAVTADLVRILTEKDAIGVLASASAFRASRDRKADDYGAQLTYDHVYSQTLRGTVRLGGRFTSSTVGNRTDDSSGLLVTAILDKKYSQVTSYRFTVARSILPSGAGTVVQTDLLSATLFRKLSPRLNFKLWGTAFNEKSVNQNAANVSRIYVSIEPSLRYQLTRYWSIDGSYRYRWQKYRSQAHSGEDHGVFVAVNYDWPRIAVSR